MVLTLTESLSESGAARRGAGREHVIGFVIAVGKAAKPAMPKGGQLALSEVVVQDRFA